MPRAVHNRTRTARSSVTLGTLAVGSFATGTDSFVIAGVLPDVATDLGTTTTAVGVTVALFAIAYALGGPVLVSYCAPWSPRRVLIGSMTVFVAANLAAALAPTVVSLGAARVIAALGAGVYVPTAIAVAARIGGDDRRARSVSVVVGGASVALVLGAPMGTLIADATSWRASFLAISFIGILAIVGVSTVISGGPSGISGGPLGTSPPRADRRAVLSRPDVLAVLVLSVLLNAAAFAVYPYLAVLFPDSSSTMVALLVFAFGAGAVVGTWAGGRAADGFGATATVVVAVSVFALDHATLGLVAGSAGMGIAYAFGWGVTGWATIPAQQSRLIATTGPVAPLALSLNSSAIHLGTGIGALVGAALVAGPGPQYIWVFATATALIALLTIPVGESARRKATV